MKGERLTEAMPVSIEKIAESGPGLWWFVHHPDGFLIEAGRQERADQVAREINAGRAVLATHAEDTSHG